MLRLTAADFHAGFFDENDDVEGVGTFIAGVCVCLLPRCKLMVE